MNLTSEDTTHFYRLMGSLQYFVKETKGLLKEITSRDEFNTASSVTKLEVRDALWANPGLIDDYLQKNPEGFSDADLEIIRKWKGFIIGTFFIVRHLKKYSILIDDREQVYCIVGLITPLEDLLPTDALPIMLNTVLLPFKGKIIYDGLLSPFNSTFGRGIRSNLNDAYTFAKQKDQLITTFEPELFPVPVKTIRKNDQLPKLDALASQIASLKGDTPLLTAAIVQLRASMEMVHLIAKYPKDISAIDTAQAKLHRTQKRLNKMIELEF